MDMTLGVTLFTPLVAHAGIVLLEATASKFE